MSLKIEIFTDFKMPSVVIFRTLGDIAFMPPTRSPSPEAALETAVSPWLAAWFWLLFLSKLCCSFDLCLEEEAGRKVEMT
jgi:hypothetical protein